MADNYKSTGGAETDKHFRSPLLGGAICLYRDPMSYSPPRVRDPFSNLSLRSRFTGRYGGQPVALTDFVPNGKGASRGASFFHRSL